MERRGFIGGSDLYSIMKGDWYKLWLVKMGLEQPDDLSRQFNVQLGTYTEDFNLDWLEAMHNYKRLPNSEFMPAVTMIAGVPYKGLLDGMVERDGQRFVVECSHTSSTRSMSQMLENYLPQMHLYMRLTGVHKSILSVIFGNQYEFVTVDFDEDFWKQVHTKAYNFWRMVQAEKQPANFDTDRIDWSSVAIDGLVARDANKDNYFMDLAHYYVDTVTSAKQHDKIKKELRSLIKDDEREVYCDLLTIKRDKRGACRIIVNTAGTEV